MEPLPTDSEDPAERFEIAKAVHRRTEADLAALQRSSNRLFNMSYILTVLLLCFGIVGARELYSATGSVFRTAFLLFPLPAMLALIEFDEVAVLAATKQGDLAFLPFAQHEGVGVQEGV